MKTTPYSFIFDVESIGLHGEGFAVAGGLYSPDGKCRQEFAYHCQPDRAKGDAKDRAWVAQHVTIGAESLEYATPKEMRDAFWETWMHMKQHLGAEMFVECGWPVEAAFLEACIKDDERRNWEGPYPLHEIASFMLAAGLDPMAAYAREERELPAHEALADARLSARLLFASWKMLDPNRKMAAQAPTLA
jgi:hypothetical protein